MMIGLRISLAALILAGAFSGAQEKAAWEQMIQSAAQLTDEGRYAEAEHILLPGLKNTKEIPGNGARYAGVLTALGTVYHYMGRDAEAERLLRESVAVLEQSLGNGSPFLLRPLEQLTAVHIARGHYDQAERTARRGLEIGTAHLGPDHPKLAMLLRDFGNTYLLRNNPRAAEPFFRRALALVEEGNPRDLPPFLNDMGALSWALGRREEAVAYLGRSVAMLEQQAGRDHPELAEPLANLAAAYCASGRCPLGENLFDRALIIAEKRWGRQHIKVAQILSIYATALQTAKQTKKAKAIQQRARAMRRALAADDLSRHTVSVEALRAGK
jgi:tetratricopeptide (TPR) repeat protein